ncbi:UDP-N-acetylglucosamine--N-acetylmuramyl-(pentapeptide) pyrophosphoryl-undecaprenol N-acetylglucosamine transferase [Capsicum chinense]|nr:UDP-N-acetylglucosamine--N-acetylmuramyl-(pentapeptide) pyrophosphoryl-undecaprenol N-acetylglucosamine transferase [Capsicum chinense]
MKRFLLLATRNKLKALVAQKSVNVITNVSSECRRSLLRQASLFCLKFLHSNDLAYAAPDIILIRVEAMIFSEILATGKPCIMIPSPDIAEGHQFFNACIMADLAY